MARVAPLLVAVEFGLQVLHASTLRFSETSLCSIACMRPELVCAECCDIHAVFVPLSASLVPIAASLKFCEQFYLRTSRWWSFADV